MAVKIVNFPKGTFSSIPYEDLQARLEIGVVQFSYVITSDSAAENRGTLRETIGTRNLSMSFIPFDEVPLGVRVPPPHVLTYYDLDRDAWRACNKFAITSYSEDIYIET